MNKQVRSRITNSASAIALAMAAWLFLPAPAYAEGDSSLTGILQIGSLDAAGPLNIAQANGRRGGNDGRDGDDDRDGRDDDDDDHDHDDDDDHDHDDDDDDDGKPPHWPGHPHPDTGERNEAVITQNGSNNTASIDQTGEGNGAYSISGSWGHKKPDKHPGDGNSDNFASILQNGNGNEAAIVQDGSNLEGKIKQTGNANFATLDQTGNGLSYKIDQNGADTTLRNGIVLHDVTSVAVTQSNMGVGVTIAP